MKKFWNWLFGSKPENNTKAICCENCKYETPRHSFLCDHICGAKFNYFVKK